MNKHLSLFVILIILITLSSNALALENMTGEIWSGLEKESKDSYVKGLVDGLNIAIVSLASEAQPNIDVDLLALQLKREGTLLELTVIDYIHTISNINENLKYKPEKSVFDIIVENELGINPNY